MSSMRHAVVFAVPVPAPPYRNTKIATGLPAVFEMDDRSNGPIRYHELLVDTVAFPFATSCTLALFAFAHARVRFAGPDAVDRIPNCRLTPTRAYFAAGVTLN